MGVSDDDFVRRQAVAWNTYRRTSTHEETANGPGSLPASTQEVRDWLPYVVKKYDIKTMLDAPCGDLAWMAEVDLSALDAYTGWDVEPGNVVDAETRSKRVWASPADLRGRMKFSVANLLTIKEIPQFDLIFCRDFLQHLPNYYINRVRWLFRDSGSRYLITNNYREADNKAYPTDPDGGHTGWCGRTDELPGYYYRPVNLEAEPFTEKGRLESIVETVEPAEQYSEMIQELVLFDLSAR